MLSGVPDLLDRIRRELDDRLAELKPIADEFARLQRATDALDQLSGDSPPRRASPPSVRPAPVPAPARTPAKPAARRRSGAARAAPGQTQLRVIEHLRSGPGSTSTAVAAALGISANAAAATISRLVKQGRVQRLETGGYSSVEASPAAAPPAVTPPPPASDA